MINFYKPQQNSFEVFNHMMNQDSEEEDLKLETGDQIQISELLKSQHIQSSYKGGNMPRRRNQKPVSSSVAQKN